jgi:hypothetical protein
MSFLSNLTKRVSAAVLALGLSTGLAAACPYWNNPVVFGTGTFDTGALPNPMQSAPLTAGGRIDLSRCISGAWGYVIQRPDYRLNFTNSAGHRSLTFTLYSNATDTVLLVNDANGNWYFDDDGAGNLNSQITIVNPPQGQYDVWTGSYNRSSNNPAQLWISSQ